MRIVLILLIIVVLGACKTPKPTVYSNHETLETKHDSNAVSIKDSSASRLLRETTPATNNQINATVGIDSNGIQPFSITVSSGTDTLKLQGKGNQINAKSNCAEKERILQETIRDLKQQITNKNTYTKETKHTDVVVSVIVHKETPWYDWFAFGVLLSIILYLIIRKR